MASTPSRHDRQKSDAHSFGAVGVVILLIGIRGLADCNGPMWRKADSRNVPQCPISLVRLLI
jgi:hypothetical protein